MKIVTTILLIIFCVSCTQKVRIANSEIDEINPKEAKFWRIKTIAGEKYSVKELEVEETNLIIREFSRSDPRYNKFTQYEEKPGAELRIVIPVSDVAILERVDIDKQKTFLIIATITTALFVSLWEVSKVIPISGFD